MTVVYTFTGHVAGTNTMSDQQDSSYWQRERERMVEEQIRRRGVRDERVLEAMRTVAREEFVPAPIRAAACEDRALPIEQGQTISQPFIVAFMTEHLQLTSESRVLEIGTGSGYQTAILARLARHVYSIERLPSLQALAEANLARLGVTNVTLTVGDGSLGLPEFAPYDRIIGTAAAPGVPRPLVEQLVDGGIMVLPVGGAADQTIVRVVRDGPRCIETPLLACRFVKLVGQQGWIE